MRHSFYGIAHDIQTKIPFVWNGIEKVNEILFVLRYGRKIKQLPLPNPPINCRIVPLKDIPADKIADFFARQPANAFIYFHPHQFDDRSIRRLQRNKSYLAYLLIDNTNHQIAGYCFNRCFFVGKGFRGRMVDINYRKKGFGTAMNRILNEVGFGIGLRLFETVSKDNVASYRSVLSASHVRIVEELLNNELYLEILQE